MITVLLPWELGKQENKRGVIAVLLLRDYRDFFVSTVCFFSLEILTDNRALSPLLTYKIPRYVRRSVGEIEGKSLPWLAGGGQISSEEGDEFFSAMLGEDRLGCFPSLPGDHRGCCPKSRG